MKQYVSTRQQNDTRIIETNITSYKMYEEEM